MTDWGGKVAAWFGVVAGVSAALAALIGTTAKPPLHDLYIALVLVGFVSFIVLLLTGPRALYGAWSNRHADRVQDLASRPEKLPADLYTFAGDQNPDNPTLGAPQAASPQATAKTEPPTHVVDSYHRGDFATVGEAVKAARPGDRILVRPGLYPESLLIDKPLEILGDGPADDIQIYARDAPAVRFIAEVGRIANLTLRQAGGPGGFCVDITHGRLELEGCDITSQAGGCVAIRNGANPRLRHNSIHDGVYGGVWVYDQGLGTLEDNDITANASDGVLIWKGGNPMLQRNTIHGNKGAGVRVYDQGLGTLEDNNITANANEGVLIGNGGNPMLRRNTIHGNRYGGVRVDDQGLGMLKDNDISANPNAGVEISAGGNATLRHNSIHDNSFVGVMVQGQGTLEDNDITANPYAGVEIRAGGKPTLRRNTIHDNGNVGVMVQGLGTLEDNDITANASAGVSIGKGGNPTLRHNRINRNGLEAVRISDDGKGVFEDNDLTGNNLGAWNITAESQRNVMRARNRE